MSGTVEGWLESCAHTYRGSVVTGPLTKIERRSSLNESRNPNRNAATIPDLTTTAPKCGGSFRSCVLSASGLRCPLRARRDVLVATQDVVRVVLSLQRLEAFERLIAEGGTKALDRLVGLHVVDVAAADRPRLDRRCRITRPFHLPLVKGRVQPARHDADIESRFAEADSRGAWIGVLRRAVQGFDQNLAGGPAERNHAPEQLVEQLVGELAHEVALPVVAVRTVGRVEDVLLGQERVHAHPVIDKPGHRAQRAQLRGIAIRAGVAGCDDESWHQRLVE